MKGRWTKLRNGGEITDTNWLHEAVAKGMDGLKDAVLVVVAQGHPGDLPAVRTRKQPVGDLAHDGWVENGNGSGRIEQTYDAEGAVSEGTVEVGYEDTAAEAIAWARRSSQFSRNCAQDSEVEFENNAEIRLGGTGLRDGAETGHRNADKQGLPSAVVVTLVAERG